MDFFCNKDMTVLVSYVPKTGLIAENINYKLNTLTEKLGSAFFIFEISISQFHQNTETCNSGKKTVQNG